MAAGNSQLIINLLDERDALNTQRRMVKRRISKLKRGRRDTPNNVSQGVNGSLARINGRLEEIKQELIKLGFEAHA